MVEGPALRWTGTERLQSVNWTNLGKAPVIKGWVRDAAQHLGHPADRALPMWQGPCAEEFVLRAEPSTEGKHTGPSPLATMLLFPRDAHASSVPRCPHPQSCHKDHLSSPFLVGVFACQRQHLQTPTQVLPCSIPVGGVDQAMGSVPLFGALCARSRLDSSTATSGSPCKSSSHLMWSAVGWELYNLSI